MYDRLSGYDYKYEEESNVSKCSFGSYKDYHDVNPLLDTFYWKYYGEKNLNSTFGSKKQGGPRRDLGVIFRQRHLMLTALHLLNMHKLKSQNERHLRN